MTPAKKMKLDMQFWIIGLRAVKSHAKAKLYAKVNCEDNFSLAMMLTAHDAILDAICLLDRCRWKAMPDVWDWFNDLTKKGRNRFTPFDDLCRNIARKAYKDIKS